MVFVAVSILLNAVFMFMLIRRQRRPHEVTDWSGKSQHGYSVETDCRHCRRVNRVPSTRLLDGPRCGNCKAPLMPGRRLVIVEATPITGTLNIALTSSMDDADQLWRHLHDHIATSEAKRRDVMS
jgi:thioredoxin family protein